MDIPDHLEHVTALLLQWGKGDESARERLIPLVHRELHQIARRCMAGERAGHSLQATSLVNEAYVRLVDGKAVAWQDRAHFLAVAARVMRRILVDHARARAARKRGGDGARVTFDTEKGGAGWVAPKIAPWLEQTVEQSSQTYFGKGAMTFGEGGSIPFMGMLGARYPTAQFLITGVLGPQSNAHGPNEFLHVPYAKALTACVAEVLVAERRNP